MSERDFKDLERLTQRIEEADSPEKRKAAQEKLQQYLDAHINNKAQLIEHCEDGDLKLKQDQMRGRLEEWDTEAREILEREISDPEILKAALDNAKYRGEVIVLAGTPLSELGKDGKDPLVSKAEEALARVEILKQRESKMNNAGVLMRWAMFIVLTVLIVWSLVNVAVKP